MRTFEVEVSGMVAKVVNNKLVIQAETGEEAINAAMVEFHANHHVHGMVPNVDHLEVLNCNDITC